MLSLSITTGYAIRALSCLDSGACESHKIGHIACCSGVPRPYLAKIMHALSTKGLVTTKRGYRGGILLTRPLGEISLLEIVIAVEGEEWMGPCLLGLEDCGDGAGCPTRELWTRIRGDIEDSLGKLTLADVIQSRRKLRPECCTADEPASSTTRIAPPNRHAAEPAAPALVLKKQIVPKSRPSGTKPAPRGRSEPQRVDQS